MQRSDERETETTANSDESLTGSNQEFDFDVGSDLESDVETNLGADVTSETTGDGRRLPTIRSLLFVIVVSAVGFVGAGPVPIIGPIGPSVRLLLPRFRTTALRSKAPYRSPSLSS